MDTYGVVMVVAVRISKAGRGATVAVGSYSDGVIRVRV